MTLRQAAARTALADPLPVDAHGRSFHVEWDSDAPATPLGQLVFFSQFFATAGLFLDWAKRCPSSSAATTPPNPATGPVRSLPTRAFEDLILSYLGEIGRHAEIIESALRASNEAKAKSIRPLKSKLAGLEKQHRKLSKEVQDCIEAEKRKGAKNVADAFMAEAERLSTEKQQVELGLAKVNVEINYLENVVADKQVISEALLRFEAVVKSLPTEDQKELMQLIVREISVKHFDPKLNQAPREKGVFSTEIRTNSNSLSR